MRTQTIGGLIGFILAVLAVVSIAGWIWIGVTILQ